VGFKERAEVLAQVTVIIISLLQECGFLISIFNVSSNRDQSIVYAWNSNITRLSLVMPMVYEEFVFWIGEGDREERKKERCVG
jgi:hypothetical protein